MSSCTSTRSPLCSSSSTNFSSNGCSQSGNGSPLTGFELDMSTSATLSGTSLTHSSGMTFRSWVSIGLTGVVNAIPAGENADQYFDHCSLAGVPPSGPRRTHRFLVATIMEAAVEYYNANQYTRLNMMLRSENHQRMMAPKMLLPKHAEGKSIRMGVVGRGKQ